MPMFQIDFSDGYGYADTGFEQDEKISDLFLQDDEKLEAIRLSTQQKIERLSDRLGLEESPELTLPKKGLLRRKLGPAQRRRLNNWLGPYYAAELSQQQENIESIPIEENNEPMMDIEKALYGRADYTLNTYGFHNACGPFAKHKRIFHLRREVAHNVARVFEALSEIDLRGHVEDCWRPPQVQEGLYIRRLIGIAKRHDWKWEEVQTAANSLTAYAPGFAGHQAGAAIDWRLCAKEDSREPTPLDLGNEYPEGGAASSLYFPYLTAKQWETRQIFANVSRMGGFKLLLSEDWHMSYRDRGLGKDGSAPPKAYYGPFKDFDRETGKISKMYDPDDVDQPFLNSEEAQAVIELVRKRNAEQDTSEVQVSDFDEGESRDVISLLNKMRNDDRRRRARLDNWFKESLDDTK